MILSTSVRRNKADMKTKCLYQKNYCAKETRICTPALVAIVGADVEIYGVTLR